MQLEEFLDFCFLKEQIQHFLKNYNLKVAGNKDILIQRLIAETEFDVDDIPDMLYHEELQEVCDILELPRSGRKSVLWDRIIQQVEIPVIKEIVYDLKIKPHNDHDSKSKQELAIPFEAYEGPEPFIFVSYSHEDKDIVYKEIRRLDMDGFNIWYDEGISPARIWANEIAQAIEACSLFLVFISLQSISSQFVNKEINFAITEKKDLLAIYLEKTKLTSGIKLQIGNIPVFTHHLLEKTARERFHRGAIA